MAVAVGFSAYLNDLLDNVFGFHLPTSALATRCSPRASSPARWFNLPALLMLIMLLTWILVRGVRESARDQQHAWC